MVLLDWFFIGLLSLAMLCFLFVLFCLFYFFTIKIELKRSQSRRPKKKSKRKKWIRERQLLIRRQKRYLKNSLIFIVILFLALGSAVYARYYQLTNLTSEDAKVVVQGYLLTEDLEQKLGTIKEGGSIEKVYPQFQEVSSLLVTYGNRPVSAGLSKEGAKLLSRYYVSMKYVGMNLSTLTQEQLGNKEIMESYLKDLSKINERQKEVFTYFKVNESALKQKN